jgi:hypothetical protein
MIGKAPSSERNPSAISVAGQVVYRSRLGRMEVAFFQHMRTQFLDEPVHPILAYDTM